MPICSPVRNPPETSWSAQVRARMHPRLPTRSPKLIYPNMILSCSTSISRKASNRTIQFGKNLTRQNSARFLCPMTASPIFPKFQSAPHLHRSSPPMQALTNCAAPSASAVRLRIGCTSMIPAPQKRRHRQNERAVIYLSRTITAPTATSLPQYWKQPAIRSPKHVMAMRCSIFLKQKRSILCCSTSTCRA